MLKKNSFIENVNTTSRSLFYFNNIARLDVLLERVTYISTNYLYKIHERLLPSAKAICYAL